jgi:ribosomal protein L11 methyltransferase
MSVTRVDILAEKGTDQLLSDAFYSLCKATWVEEHDRKVVMKCYPEEPEKLLAYLCSSRLPVERVTVVEEEEKDYAELVRMHFSPVRVGAVTILPPWKKTARKGPTIVIEPGMAFGTGRHESTKLMLKMMSSREMKGKKVLDIGSGSGILAVYASILGASRVIAIDNDPLAGEAGQKSCALNRVTNVFVACANLTDIKGTFDIVLANLDFNTFKASTPDILKRVKKGGYLVISGIEKQFAADTTALFKPLAPVERRSMNGWYGFVFKIDTKQRNK